MTSLSENASESGGRTGLRQGRRRLDPRAHGPSALNGRCSREGVEFGFFLCHRRTRRRRLSSRERIVDRQVLRHRISIMSLALVLY
jgi:hypothetical protein